MEIKDMKLHEIRERLDELKEFEADKASLEEIEANTAELRQLIDREAEILKAAEARKAEADRVTNLPDSEAKVLTQFKEEEKRMEDKIVETQEQIELRQFADYVRGRVTEMETRASEQNFTFANSQAAIVPVSIAQRIIDEVKERSPILAGATLYNVKGTLKVPVYGDANTNHNITVAYANEFEELVGDAGKFTSIDLSGHLVGVLSLIGRTLINNADIDLVNFVVMKMAESIALFLEGELLNGTSSKATGALSSTNVVAAGAVDKLTADALIDLQAKIPTVFQAKAVWTMHPKTFTAVKKLKDGEGRYLLQHMFSEGFPYRLLGKPVHVSENMPEIDTNALAILYGDYSGLSVNFREDISIEILREKYATMHALGVVGWFEFDSKITESQKLAVMKMAVSL